MRSKSDRNEGGRFGQQRIQNQAELHGQIKNFQYIRSFFIELPAGASEGTIYYVADPFIALSRLGIAIIVLTYQTG